MTPSSYHVGLSARRERSGSFDDRPESATLPMVGSIDDPPDKPATATLVKRLDAAIELAKRRSLSCVQAAVLRHVVYRAGPPSFQCFQRVDEMAQELCANARTVQRALRFLVGIGLLKAIERPRQSTIYTLAESHPYPGTKSPYPGRESPLAPAESHPNRTPERNREPELNFWRRYAQNHGEVFDEILEIAEHSGIDGKFVVELRGEFPDVPDLEQEVLSSLNHVGSDRAKSKRQWVKDWLRRGETRCLECLGQLGRDDEDDYGGDLPW